MADRAQRLQKRLETDERPFSAFLTDDFNRAHTYLRISVTERCNLRCLYCMPEEGVSLSPPASLLTRAEIVYLASLFVSQGVTKIRLTGGEPTVRRDFVPLVEDLGRLKQHGLQELCITSNGIALERKLPGLVRAGLTGINLSLDTLNPALYQIVTRRKGLDKVLGAIDTILRMNREIGSSGPHVKLKINCVVMNGVNDRELIPFVEMTRNADIEVRFIEYMPFDGNRWVQRKMMPYEQMLDTIRGVFPTMERVRSAHLGKKDSETSKTWQIPGFQGRVGFITSMTHNFCGTCNRLRITSDGSIKVCLFGNEEVSLRDIIRAYNNGEPLLQSDWEGASQLKSDLLNVIGVAVKGKKARHAGMSELKQAKNRPMILIGG
ncbi:hypothetical protein KEM52_005404 [Ascosphaera acerosa]|nr:hypothetical protein KEM52_005404 [Ascosphaera acerosa]